jgi:hypothetical protein
MQLGFGQVTADIQAGKRTFDGAAASKCLEYLRAFVTAPCTFSGQAVVTTDPAKAPIAACRLKISRETTVRNPLGRFRGRKISDRACLPWRPQRVTIQFETGGAGGRRGRRVRPTSP